MNQRDGSQTLMLAGAAEKWTTTQAHDVTERGSGQQPTAKAGNACLARDARLWSMPAAANPNDGETPETWLKRAGELKAKHQNGNGAGMPLGIQTQIWQTPGADSFRSRGGDRKDEMGLDQQARTWPSPRAEDSESCGNHPGATDSLTGAVSLWNTPQTSNANGSREEDGKRSVGLNTQVEMWPTPKAAAGGPNSNREERESTGGPDLQEQVQKWPSPAARDYRSPNQLPDQLPNFVHHSFSLPVLSQESGEVLGSTTRILRQRLNPAFVCWLMGWPMWWTRAAPISSAAAETAWWRSRLRWHLQCCLAALPRRSEQPE